MGIQDLRLEIDTILNSLGEEELQSVLDYLNQVKELNIKELNMSSNLSKIINEDSNLLKRLAQ